MDSIEIDIPSIILPIIAIFIFFYILYKKHIINTIDPLLLNGILVCFYLAGSLAYFKISGSQNNYTIIILLCIFLTIMLPATLIKAPKEITTLQENPSKSILFFLFFIDALLLVNILVNYFFGVIPILNGTETRAELGETKIPSLVLMAPYLGMICIISTLYNSERSTYLLASIGIILYTTTTLMNGSKSGGMQLTLNFLLILYLRLIKIHKTNPKLKDVIKKPIALLVTALFTIISLAYFNISLGTSNQSNSYDLFFYRLLTGFDSVILSDLHNINIISTNPFNAFEFYIYPYLSKLGMPPEFRSAGHYIASTIFGKDIADSGLNPNSNLVIEWIGTAGPIAGTIISTGILSIAMSYRNLFFKKDTLKVYDLFFSSVLLTNPFFPLLDGSYFFTIFTNLLFIYIAINTLHCIMTKNWKLTYAWN